MVITHDLNGEYGHGAHRACADAVIQAAAPADYRFRDVSDQKIKKKDGGALTFTLEETPDIAAAVGRMKRPGQVLVGFAAETENLLAHAEKKLASKNLDFIVANDVTQPGAGFNVDTNIATFLSAEGANPRPLQTKRQLAEDILDEVEKRLKGKQ